jgi:diguanylate cyclase (GGDEF)-like protein
MAPDTESRIQSILDTAGNLPTLPGIALRILEAVKQEDTGLKEVGDILRSDPPLATKVLQIANSSLYGMKVVRVQHAVNILGGELVKNLVLGFSLIRNTSADNSEFFDYTRFWKDSLISAISARRILQERAPSLMENAFILGLIHNIGILFLVQSMPREYEQVIRTAREEGTPQHEVEERLLGVTHLQLGTYIAKKWGFPDTLTIPIAYHHSPEAVPERGQNQILTETLHFAVQFSNFFHATDKGLHLALIERILRYYRIDQLVEIDDLVEHVQDQTQDIFPIFELSVKDDHNYIQIVEEARQELINSSRAFIERHLAQQNEIERLRVLATHDPLTKVHNFQKFTEDLDNELERVHRYHSRFSFCFLDIDDFKTVNDTHGHLTGDKVLKSVADYLRYNVRQTDVVARYGGDEFVLLMPGLTARKACQAMERLREGIAQMSTVVENVSIRVTVSCGVFCVSPETITSKDEVLKQADRTMYEAKHADKNKTVISRT